ncbi:unnamed protein product [Parnassius mnemosyne]|uniref:Neurotransmitter-gated ion-channel ligand-binding domain-containing protein n=1 Tax=Parnassius mnemosyne TaxID=213953 RepID=A0AAV1LKT2_9NEOP
MIVFSSGLLFFLLCFVKCDESVMDNHSPNTAWEHELRKDLLFRYNSRLPPDEINTQVALKFILKSFYFDDNEEILTIYTWVFLLWNDPRLAWNPDSYDGIMEVLISSFSIWTPRMEIYSITDEDGINFLSIDIRSLLCRVMSNGQVTCIPRFLHRTACSSKLRDWPYDTMNCTFKFGSRSKLNHVTFTFNSSRVMTMLGAEYGPGWNIINFSSGEDSKSAVKFYLNFILERQGVGLAAVILVPSLLLSILTLLCMVINVNDKTRLGLLCFSLLNQFSFLRKICTDLPKKMSEIPTVLLYLRTSIILTLLAIGITYFLCYIRGKTSPAPNFIEIFIRKMTGRYGKYLIWPRWNARGNDCDNEHVDTKDVWTDFASITNFIFMIIITVVYTSSFFALIPQQQPES